MKVINTTHSNTFLIYNLANGKTLCRNWDDMLLWCDYDKDALSFYYINEKNIMDMDIIVCFQLETWIDDLQLYLRNALRGGDNLEDIRETVGFIKSTCIDGFKGITFVPYDNGEFYFIDAFNI